MEIRQAPDAGGSVGSGQARTSEEEDRHKSFSPKTQGARRQEQINGKEKGKSSVHDLMPPEDAHVSFSLSE